jgi:hypothetical protein
MDLTPTANALQSIVQWKAISVQPLLRKVISMTVKSASTLCKASEICRMPAVIGACLLQIEAGSMNALGTLTVPFQHLVCRAHLLCGHCRWSAQPCPAPLQRCGRDGCPPLCCGTRPHRRSRQLPVNMMGSLHHGDDLSASCTICTRTWCTPSSRCNSLPQFACKCTTVCKRCSTVVLTVGTVTAATTCCAHAPPAPGCECDPERPVSIW